MSHKPKKRNFYLTVGSILWLLTTALVIAPIWPHVFYRLSPQTSTVLAATINNTVPLSVPKTGELPKETTAKFPLPKLDLTLPEENGLLIDTIGVRAQIHEGEDWEEILKTGVWRIPNFGSPENEKLPMILAAHRWGYLSWSNSFRQLNSFYNLPKLKDGDKVEVIWKQRKYVYEVYKSETGEEITDYSANLILYTCQLWNSPVRIFKYLKRIS